MPRIITPAQKMIRGETRLLSLVLPRVGHSRSSTNSSRGYTRFGGCSSVERMTDSQVVASGVVGDGAVMVSESVGWTISCGSPTRRTFRTLPASCGYKYYGLVFPVFVIVCIQSASSKISSVPWALLMTHTAPSTLNWSAGAQGCSRYLIWIPYSSQAERLSVTLET